MYVCMYVCMYGWMDGWMDVCISIHPSIHLSFCLLLYLPIYLPACLSFYLSHLCIYLLYIWTSMIRNRCHFGTAHKPWALRAGYCSSFQAFLAACKKRGATLQWKPWAQAIKTVQSFRKPGRRNIWSAISQTHPIQGTTWSVVVLQKDKKTRCGKYDILNLENDQQTLFCHFNFQLPSWFLPTFCSFFPLLQRALYIKVHLQQLKGSLTAGPILVVEAQATGQAVVNN